MNTRKYRILPGLTADEWDALRDSISRLGIQQPLIQDERGNLLDGFARYDLAAELGIKQYPVKTVSGLSEEEKRHLIYELNCNRRHLTTRQKEALITAELRRAPDLSDRWVASLIGVDGKTVARVRRHLVATAEIPQLSKFRCRDGKDRRPPTSIITETVEKAAEAARVLQEIGDDGPGKLLPLDRAARMANQKAREERINALPMRPLDKDFQILHCDFQDLPVRRNSVHLILTDPPWNSDLELWQDLGRFAEQALRPGCLLAVYPGTQFLDRAILGLSESLNYVWICSHLRATHSIHYKFNLLTGWQPVLLFSKGDYRPRNKPKLIDASGKATRKEKEWHAWQQSLDEAVSYIEYLTRPGDLVVDCFGGSFQSAVACKRLGRKFLGCDSDERMVAVGRERLYAEA